MQPIDTAIVGAGPYGLSVAAHLRVVGVPHEIFGEPLESWRSFMPQGMVLKSEPFASNLWDPARRFTYEKYLAEKGIAYRRVLDPIPVERFVEYGQWFRRHAVGEVRRVKVRRVARTDGAYWLELEDGTVSKARRVVLATGPMGFRNVPDELKGLPEGMCLHSTALHDPGQFAGRDVTVIGAGASALESLALLHEAGAKTRLVARRKQIAWNSPARPNPNLIERLRAPEAGLGAGWRSWAVSELPFLYRRMVDPAKRHRIFLTTWRPAGAWWLRERVDCLEPTLRAQIAREGPYPRLNANFETSVKGLFMVGLAAGPVFGPVQRFMFGAKHAAPAVARALRRSRARDAIGRVRAAGDEPNPEVLYPDSASK